MTTKTSPEFSSRLSDIDPMARRMRFIGSLLLFAITWDFISSQLHGGWIAASVITAIVLLLCTIYIWHYQDSIFGRFLLFGLVAGWVELFADCWLVQSTGTLVYFKGGPFVLCSPLYMPFAWMGVLSYLSCIGHWLSYRWGLIAATFLTALVGAINIPLYEQWAKSAEWWLYQRTPMVGDTPLYIILGEFFIALMLPITSRWLEKLAWGWSAVLGGIGGLWIWFAYSSAFQIIG